MGAEAVAPLFPQAVQQWVGSLCLSSRWDISPTHHRSRFLPHQHWLLSPGMDEVISAPTISHLESPGILSPCEASVRPDGNPDNDTRRWRECVWQ